MAQAKLLTKLTELGRGLYRITERGLELLATNPPQINNAMLKHYPEFLGFLAGASTPPNVTDKPAVADGVETALDPDTMLEDAIQLIRKHIIEDLVERITALEPAEFERLALQLLEAIGYGKGRLTGASGDRGIDGVLDGDALGLSRVYLQCKRFANTNVGGADLRNFMGALHQHKASRGVFVTSSDFTDEARTVVRESSYSVALINGRRMAELMYDYNLGVVPDRSISTKRVDEGWFAASYPSSAKGPAKVAASEYAVTTP